MTMTKQVRWVAFSGMTRADAGGDLPSGVAGRVSGVALTYDAIDTYGTTFARGCAKRSLDGKVPARRLPLLMDHERSTEAHVGVVSSASDVGGALVITADLFDTPAGRSAVEYVKAVLAAGASTGFSVGFIPRRSERVKIDGEMIDRFLEIELREISITPMPSVPGTDVTGARKDAGTDTTATASAAASPVPDAGLLARAARLTLAAMPADERAAILAEFGVGSPDTDTADGSAANSPTRAASPISEPATVDMAARLLAVRESYRI
jgi:hypothetical protein